MRGRRVALGACAAVLALAVPPAAVAQDGPGEPTAAPATPAAPAEPAPPVAAEPAPPPATEPAPSPPAAPAPAQRAPRAEPAAPAPAARPATRPTATPAASARRIAPRKGVARAHPRRAANMSQADVQVSEFGGRVTLRDVAVLGCGAAPCESGPADYEVQDLEVRAEPGTGVLIAVRRARVTGTGDGRSVTAQVTLRPEGEPARTGEVTLRPGQDLLTQDVFAGTPLEQAYASVFTADVFGPGGALERLTIVFGEGTVIKGAFGAVSISAADRVVTVRVPVRLADGTLVRDGPLRVEGGGTDSSAPSPKRTGALRRANGDAGRDTGGLFEGGGDARDVAEDDPEEPDEEDEGGLFATITGVCVLGVGACGDDDEGTPAVRFVVDSRSATITIDRRGRGPLEIGCPTGVDDVSGTALVESAIRLGERQRRLSRQAEFTCEDGEIVEIEIELLDDELERLRDARGPVTVSVTVRATAGGGLRAVDFDVVALELAAR